MGSVFLHDDYRLPDVASSLPFKKEGTSGNSSIHGIFENNPCFASIKKELGFVDGNRTNSNDDVYAETRARSSPVVERLILQEIQNDIAEYAGSIGISLDPEQWSIDDTRKWLRWVANVYHLGDLGECLSFDGITLCNFSEQEFILLTGSEDTGLKNSSAVGSLEKCAGFYHFQQQQVMDFKFGTPQARQDTGTPKLLNASCSWTTSGHTSASATYTAGHYTHANENGMCADYNNYSSPYHQHYPHNPPTAPACFPHEEVRYPPRPTIPLDRFGSYRAACQSENFSPAQSYQRYTSMGSSNLSSVMLHVQQKSAFQMPNKELPYTPDNKMFEESLRDVPKEYINSLMGQKTYTVDPKESLKALAILSKPANTEQQPRMQQTDETAPRLKSESKQHDIKTESIEINHEEPAKAAPGADELTAKLPRKKSSKHPIHLWEFLKQLLNEGKDCIRWVDQEKGVFKIYNSQQVAKYWGERKNRPAMNYDKLSRSIRQYYKKGIIKKTSQGKRLVYQFCEGYL